MLTAATKTTQPMIKPAIVPAPKLPLPLFKPIDPRYSLGLPTFSSDTDLSVDLVESVLMDIVGAENGAESKGTDEGLKMLVTSVGEPEFTFRLLNCVGEIVGASVNGMEKLMEKLMLPKPPRDSFRLNANKQEEHSQHVENNLYSEYTVDKPYLHSYVFFKQ